MRYVLSLIRGASPLGLPDAVARSRFRARIRSGGSLAALARDLVHACRGDRADHGLLDTFLVLSEGLRPSDSPTPSLARASALASAPAARSRRSLATLSMPAGVTAPITVYEIRS